jgi:hypothetical protein
MITFIDILSVNINRKIILVYISRENYNRKIKNEKKIKQYDDV